MTNVRYQIRITGAKIFQTQKNREQSHAVRTRVYF